MNAMTVFENPANVKRLTIEHETLIYQAMASGATIIIDGDRTGPTGKSTLCDWINNHGGNAVEVWELEEWGKKLDRGKNTAYVYVQLDEKLNLSDFQKW